MKHLNKVLLFVFLLFISTTDYAFSQDEKDLKATKSDPNTPIFEIKNDLGQTVFAVYPGGVKIFVDDQQLKATGGGFTVGRIGTEKLTGSEIFSVNPNDVRVYIDETTGLKATGGGFTVGRIGTEKATADDYFSVQPNDVRVILNTTPGLKATGGGFTVGRIGTEKATGGEENFLTVTPDSTRVSVDSTSTSGFSVGKFGSIINTNFLNLTEENYFIGHESGVNNTTGLYNIFLGYKSGSANTAGNSNIFIGYEAGYNNVADPTDNRTSHWNTFIGYQAGKGNTFGWHNLAIGYLAGLNNKIATNQFFIGDYAGESLINGYGNSFIGHLSGRNSTDCANNTFVGYQTGGSNTTGDNNVYLGYATALNATTSAGNVIIGYMAGLNMTEEGGNVFIGNGAGYNETGPNKLYIANNGTNTPLIYGEFDNETLTINGSLFYRDELAQSSDKRLKTNIVQLSSALNIVQSLNGYYFNWNNKAINKLGYSKKKQLGFIAQEIEILIPELVSNAPNGYKAVDYSKMSAILVEAVKEQQKIIDKLESRIMKLEKKNEILSAELNDVQNLRSEMNELKSLVKALVGTQQESKESAQ